MKRFEGFEDDLAPLMAELRGSPDRVPASPRRKGWRLPDVPLLRSVVLVGASATSATVATLGFALLCWLVVTHALTPASDTFVRPLELDFEGPDLVGQAVFVPKAPVEGLVLSDVPSDARFLQPSQQVDIWVELQVLLERAGTAQVVAELATGDGRVVAHTSHPMLLRSGLGLRRLLVAPLRWLGLLPNTLNIKVPLFHAYRDKPTAPFVILSTSIKSRHPTWSPEVLRATAHVQLRMNILRRLVYRLRPAPLPMLLLAAAALSCTVGGGLAALLFLGLLLWASQPEEEGSEEEEGLGGLPKPGGHLGRRRTSLADELSPGSSGTSDVSSGILHEDEGGDDDQSASWPPPGALRASRSAAAALDEGSALEKSSLEEDGAARGMRPHLAHHASAPVPLDRREGGALSGPLRRRGHASLQPAQDNG